MKVVDAFWVVPAHVTLHGALATVTTTTVVQSVVFWVAAVVAIVSGVGVITARSAVYSALSLIVTLAQLAVFYILLNAQFIAAAQILIYAGAVMVLFLFVITLLGIHGSPYIGEKLPLQRTLAVLLCGLMLFGVIYFVTEAPVAITGFKGHFDRELAQGNVQAFGKELFTTFVFPFEVTPLLLIVAMVGAVSLARRRPVSVPGSIPATESEEVKERQEVSA